MLIPGMKQGKIQEKCGISYGTRKEERAHKRAEFFQHRSQTEGAPNGQSLNFGLENKY